MIRRMTAPASVVPPQPSILRTLSWAVYLGMSWTWCIGMFMPVILVSEFGVPMWFVFAIPNVIGAAAMGWMLKKPGRSERMVADHHAACVAFSSVTIAFQLFFLFWMVSQMHVIRPEVAAAAGMGGLALGWIFRRRSNVDLTAGWLVLAVSGTVLVRALLTAKLPEGPPLFPAELPGAWVGMPAVCLLGFALCPYLDLTFHRARQEQTPGAAKAAFGIGFGLFFFSMIVLTLLYAGDLTGRGGSFGSDRAVVAWVGLHMAVQIGFTVAVHVRAVTDSKRSDAPIWAGGLALLIAGVWAVAKNDFLEAGWMHDRQMFSGEFVYRMFMSFYGLVFPAYVWVCVIPWRKSRGTDIRSPVACAIVVLAAAPFFWVGFMLEKMYWLVPAVLIVLAGGPLRRGFGGRFGPGKNAGGVNTAVRRTVGWSPASSATGAQQARRCGDAAKKLPRQRGRLRLGNIRCRAG